MDISVLDYDLSKIKCLLEIAIEKLPSEDERLDALLRTCYQCIIDTLIRAKRRTQA